MNDLTNMATNVMSVTKRDGTKEAISFDKISNRLKILINKKEEFGKILQIDYIKLTQEIIGNIYDNVATSEIDELAARICARQTTDHPDFGILASRLAVSNHHKKTSPSFSEKMLELYDSSDSSKQIITKELFTHSQKNKTKINDIIDYSKDFSIDYFGFKTLERSYLLKNKNGVIIERPQDLFMRVSLAIHGNDMKSVIESYNEMSLKKFTHATPTLFNAGTPGGQLASCFLLDIKEDSIKGIYDTIEDCAFISKAAGGIGIHTHKIRATGSPICKGSGVSTGLTPMLRVFNATARYVNQGGKRNGSFAIYLETWHADIFEFLELRKNTGFEEQRARDLFYACWISDLFMKRVAADETWTLMCPYKAPGLDNVYGEEFEKLYEKYEKEGRGNKTIKARELWLKIIELQIETGNPYILFKDAANMKSNQKNLGTIKCSNLCCEIMEYTSKDETAVCNLASIALPKFVNPPKITDFVTIKTIKNCQYCDLSKIYMKKWKIPHKIIEIPDNEKQGKYPQIFTKDFTGGYTDFISAFPATIDYESLQKTTSIVTKNLNKVIDKTTYPIESAKKSNLKHRPIGIGVQGLADVYMLLDLPFESDEAHRINEKIFENIYFAAMKTSNELAKKKAEKSKSTNKKYPGAYESFEGSPLSEGKFQFDLWEKSDNLSLSKDWEELRKSVMKYGVTNSLLLAPMPTASTAQILANTECFEPITSNIYTRRVLAGEFVVVNKFLQNDLVSLGVWNNELKNELIKNNGSVQNLKIPTKLKEIYKNVWEIKMKSVINQAAERGRFICQSQSMNLFLEDASVKKINSCLFHSWRSGLKTGSYYIRTRPKSRVQQFTVELNESSVCESCSG